MTTKKIIKKDKIKIPDKQWEIIKKFKKQHDLILRDCLLNGFVSKN